MKAKTKSIRLTNREMSELLEGIPDPDLHAKISAQLDGQALEPGRGMLMEARKHLTAEGVFRSDKYPWSRDGFVPLKVTDKMAWPMLRAYAAARVGKDAEFTRDLDEALDKVGAPSMSDFLAQGEDDAGGSIGDRARAITNEVVGKMEDKELGRMHPSSPWDRETIVSFIRAAALMGLAESHEMPERIPPAVAIASMMDSLTRTHEQMAEEVRGLPAAHEKHIRRREMEDEVLRLSRKVE